MALVCRGETLNLPHMMGCLTAPLDRSREAGLFVPIPLKPYPAQDAACERQTLRVCAVGIGNENDQVS